MLTSTLLLTTALIYIIHSSIDNLDPDSAFHPPPPSPPGQRRVKAVEKESFLGGKRTGESRPQRCKHYFSNIRHFWETPDYNQIVPDHVNL